MKKWTDRTVLIVFAVITTVVGLLFSTQYLYKDICETTAAGLNVLYSLSEGRLGEFYSSYLYPGVELSYIQNGVIGGAYDFIIYVIFAIYNIPSWIWEKITGLSVFDTYATRVYIKGITWVASALAGYILYKISLECDVEKKIAKWGVLLFFSSQLFFLSEVIVGGYDVLSVIFILLGIYGYIKRDVRCFYWSFAVAIGLKLFAFWIFIPLLLLREKRITWLCLRFLQSISVILVPKTVFYLYNYFSQRLSVQSSATGDEIIVTTYNLSQQSIISHANLVNELMFPIYDENPAPLSLGTFPVAIAGMIGLWLFCWFLKKDLDKRQIIYICCVAMSIFFLGAGTHPYWSILLCPFIVFLIIFHIEHYEQNLMLEGIFSIAYVLFQSLERYWCVGLNLIVYMKKTNWIAYPGHRIQYGDTGMLDFWMDLERITGIELDNLGQLGRTVFAVGLLYFLFMNYIWCFREKEKKEFVINRKFYVAVGTRLFISILFGFMPWIGMYYIFTYK